MENSYKNEEIVLDYTDFQDVSIKNKEETDNHKESMMDIINYLYRDEEKHFGIFKESDEDRKNHIFLKIVEVKKYLESN